MGMTSKTEPTVNVVVNARGIKMVQFCGEGWEDEAEANRIYHLIKSHIQEIDRILKGTSTSSDVVQ